MAIPIFFQIVYKKHYASCCSCSSLLSLVGLLVVIIMSFVTTYYTGSFWMMDWTGYEKPKVSYANEALIILDGKLNNNGGEWLWSTNQYFNSQLGEGTIQALSFEYNEIDNDHDGINDAIQFLIKIPLQNNQEIYSISIYPVFNYNLETYAKLLINGIVPIKLFNSIAGSKIISYGEIKLHQRNILPKWASLRKYYINDKLLNFDNFVLEELDIENILNRYYSRNYSLYSDNFDYIWKPYFSSIGGSNTMIINSTFYIPLQPIIYEPDIAQILKFGWIQYLSIFVVLGVFVYCVLFCLFTNQYFTTDIKEKSKID